MNILKKLKLALLATSVMLFPKAGHSMMKSEDETASAHLLPASSSNSLPAAAAALTLQQTIIPGSASRDDMRREFHREFQSSKEIEEALTSLRKKYIKTNERFIDTNNYDAAISYIHENIFEQYVFPYNIASQWGRPTDIDIDPDTMKVLGPTLRNLALTSLNIVLEEGTDALGKRLNKINEIVYHRLRNVAMNDPLVNNLKAQRDELFYLSSIKKPIKSFLESQRNPHYISLISDLLRLQPEEMESFTSIINNKKRFMDKIETNDSLFLPVFSDIDKDMLREERISVLGFLAKKSTAELNEIQNELEKLVPEKSRGSRMHRNTLKQLMVEDKDFNPSQINKIATSQPSGSIETGPSSSSSAPSSTAQTRPEEERSNHLVPTSSSQFEPEAQQQIRPSVKLNPNSFAIVRDDIKGRGLTTPFSFKPSQEGLFEVTGEGTLFYQLLPKPLMDTYLGQKFLLEAEIKSETPGGYLQYFNGNERVMSNPYPGGNGWQKLQLEFTVKDGSRCHIIYPLVMPPKEPGAKVPVAEVRNINLIQVQPSGVTNSGPASSRSS